MDNDWLTSAGISRPVKRRGMGGGCNAGLCIYDKSERFARPMRCSHRPSAADLPDQFFYLGQNARNDRIDACGARMKSIALIERALASNAVEEKGVEQEVVTPGQLGIDGIEIAPISTIEIGRRPHAGEQHRDAPLREATHDLFEGAPRDLRICAA